MPKLPPYQCHANGNVVCMYAFRSGCAEPKRLNRGAYQPKPYPVLAYFRGSFCFLRLNVAFVSSYPSRFFISFSLYLLFSLIFPSFSLSLPLSLSLYIYLSLVLSFFCSVSPSLNSREEGKARTFYTTTKTRATGAWYFTFFQLCSVLCAISIYEDYHAQPHTQTYSCVMVLLSGFWIELLRTNYLSHKMIERNAYGPNVRKRTSEKDRNYVLVESFCQKS